MSIITAVAFLAMLAINEGVSVGNSVGDPCLCLNKERNHIGRQIEALEVKPANSQCPEVEIIATLKTSGLKICLDPSAPWVEKVLQKIRAGQTM